MILCLRNKLKSVLKTRSQIKVNPDSSIGEQKIRSFERFRRSKVRHEKKRGLAEVHRENRWYLLFG